VERKRDRPTYDYPIEAINPARSVGQPAGVYWLDGRVIIAAFDSPDEQRLLDAGAVLAAMLRFDSDPRERAHRGRAVERVDAARAARDLPEPAVN
jgi:hypothetical protein